MSLKQSCFKAVIKSDIKRLWWISVLAAAFMLLFVTMPLIETLNYFYPETFSEVYLDSHRTENQWLHDQLTGNYFFAVMLGAFLSLGLFTYLNNVSSVTFNHSLPIKRSGLMHAHSVSALILIIFPILLNSVICIFSVFNFCNPTMIFVNFGLFLVYALLFYAVFTFVGVLTGNTPSHGIFSVVLLLLPLFLTGFTLTLCDSYLYGFTDTGIFEDILIKYFYLNPQDLMGPKLLIYLALIAVFYILSIFIYNKRHLENYGEVIAFPNLKWLFKLSFGICAGILGYFYCKAFWNFDNILIMLVFGSIGVIIANMLSNKSFSLRGSKYPLIYNAVFVALLFAIFKLDITGFENRVPDVNSVKSVVIVNNQYDGREYTFIDNRVGYDHVQRTDYFSPVFTQKSEILNFVNFHNNKIKSKNNTYFETSKLNNLSGLPRHIDFEYTLKNGTKLRRRYSIDDSDIQKYFKPIIESDQYKKYQYPILDETEKTFTMIRVFTDRENMPDDKNYGVFTSGDERMTSIISALKKDRQSITFNQYLAKHNTGALCRIEVTYKVPAIDNDGKERMLELSEIYSVHNFDTNTLSALEKAGCVPKNGWLDAENVTKIELDIGDVYKDGKSVFQQYYNEYEQYVTYDKYMGKTKTIHDKDDIAQICDYILNQKTINPFDEQDYVFVHMTFSYSQGHTQYRTYYDTFDNLPNVIEELAR